MPNNSKIAFPFDTAEYPEDVEVLRQKAQEQEAANPAVDYYKDTLSGTVNIDSWPTDSTFDTVHFYEFPTYSSTNKVVWNANLPCTDASRKGVIVVENGNFEIAGNRGGFNGTIVVRGGNDPSTGLPYSDRGKFTSAGGSCVTGYANSSGTMDVAGSFNSGTVPGLSTISAFAGGMKLKSWRELYE